MASADRLIEIFNEAKARPAGTERDGFLTGSCGDDTELKAQVLTLLSAHEGAGEFLRAGPALSPEIEAELARLKPEEAGERIGPYKLCEQIGEGGFGVVWVAEQQEPVRRTVALKIIKMGMDTHEVVARFEQEKQALAMMDHPNIARVFDAGATEHGRPFFVMELVRGVKITDYCDQANLPTAERLALFITVCHAVQHAHQKGIIHRDLKPSNILVTQHDDVAVPKVIDFGIAKATVGQLTDKTAFTAFAQFIGTPAYMSPEQAQMSGLDIDTRADIYSLGVLLYELLTGNTPFDAKELLAAGMDEMRRKIREDEPAKPSTCLSTMQALDLTTVARRRHVEPPRLIHLIRGDLDWLVMKCLEKDRTRRYDTANALAMDLQRHLDNEPVVARPPSNLYRFQKLVRRNKLAFAAGTVVLIVLLGGIAASTWQAIRASRAELEQARERTRAERRLKAALKFTDEVFDNIARDLGNLIGASKSSDALNEAGLRLMEELREDESPDSTFRFVLGGLYLRLAFRQGWPSGNTAGDYEAGLKSAKEAIRLVQPTKSETPDDERADRLARAEMVAGFASMRLLRHAEALSHFQEMEQWADLLANSKGREFVAHGLIYKRWASDSKAWALIEAGHAREALADLLLPSLRERQARQAASHATNASDLHDLQSTHWAVGRAYNVLGDPGKALPHLREACQYAEAVARLAPNNAQLAITHLETQAELGEVLVATRQSEEGLSLLTNALQKAKDLSELDPANSGFVQLQITMLRRNALGRIIWSEDVSAMAAEGRQRLEQAQAYLERAETLLATLRSESLRNWLRLDLESARAKLTTAKAKFAATNASKAGQHP